MRTGKKKVLIGSTDKCGTGVNVQTHLVAMHHVDCPWKPSYLFTDEQLNYQVDIIIIIPIYATIHRIVKSV